MELSNQHYLGNDKANPFYYAQEPCVGVLPEGIVIHEGDCSRITCRPVFNSFCYLDERWEFDENHPEHVPF